MALTKITGGMIDPTAITPAAISDQANSSTGYFDLPSGTTAQRPGSPTSGMQRMNTTTGFMEYYNGSAWDQIASPYSVELLVVAGGGGGGAAAWLGPPVAAPIVPLRCLPVYFLSVI